MASQKGKTAGRMICNLMVEQGWLHPNIEKGSKETEHIAEALGNAFDQAEAEAELKILGTIRGKVPENVFGDVVKIIRETAGLLPN